ncbi:hypothetical protein ACH2FV_19730 (plasmid) [Bacillus safensis subsp. safensis]|uniref:hypothetical protein n=1 Tax=Bacillus safensis TaxID=561879 RepID=UPI0037C18FAB
MSTQTQGLDSFLSGGGGADFLTFKEGTPKTLLFIDWGDSLMAVREHYDQSLKPSYIRCPGKDVCPLCAANPTRYPAHKAKFRVYDSADGKIKFVNMSKKHVQSLNQNFNFDQVDPRQEFVTIYRSGSGASDTQYQARRANPAPNYPNLQAMEMPDIMEQITPHTPEQITGFMQALLNSTPPYPGTGQQYGGQQGGFPPQQQFGGAPGGFPPQQQQQQFGGQPGGFPPQQQFGGQPGGFPPQQQFGGQPGGFPPQQQFGGQPGGFAPQQGTQGAPPPPPQQQQFGGAPGGFPPPQETPGGFPPQQQQQQAPPQQPPAEGFNQSPPGNFGQGNAGFNQPDAQPNAGQPDPAAQGQTQYDDRQMPQGDANAPTGNLPW